MKQYSVAALKKEVNVKSDTSVQQDAKIQYYFIEIFM
jgi:hypothetical protein